MVALRVCVSEDIEEDCVPRGASRPQISLCPRMRKDYAMDASQLSQSKKRVLMSMNSLPNSDRFWQ